jgi:hypothetical protein
MKKIPLSLVLLALIGSIAFLISCNEQLEEPIMDPANNTQVQQPDFENDILYLMSILKDEYTLTITDTGAENYTFKIYSTGAQGRAKAIVCKGVGVSFANCVDAWMHNNPGRCLTIYLIDGTYYADDDC